MTIKMFLRTIFLLATMASSAPTTSITANRLSTTNRDGTTYTVFEHATTGTKMQFVKNSGIYETTPGVNQYSGYLSVSEDMNMWFWYSPLHPPFIPLSYIPLLILDGEKVLRIPAHPPNRPPSSLVQRRPRLFFDDRAFPRERALSLSTGW